MAIVITKILPTDGDNTREITNTATSYTQKQIHVTYLSILIKVKYKKLAYRQE